MHIIKRGSGVPALLVAAFVLGPVVPHAGAATSRAAAPQVVGSRDGVVLRSRIVGKTTRLVRVSPDPARILELDSQFQLRLVEPGGRRAVLADPLAAGASSFIPGGRTSTHLVVADLVARTARTYHLDGNVEPEAFAVGSPVLFVVDHLPASDPVSYRVAALDLSAGQLGNVRGPVKTPLAKMTATGRQQVPAPSGTQLYTLYVETAHESGYRSDRGYDHSDEDSEAYEARASGYGNQTKTAWTSAFVHVLDLDEAWAYCVNLPVEFGLGDAKSAAIAIGSDGRQLFVADARAQSLVIIDTQQLARSALASTEPQLTHVPLPTAVGTREHIALANNGPSVTLTAHGTTWTLDRPANTWTVTS